MRTTLPRILTVPLLLASGAASGASPEPSPVPTVALTTPLALQAPLPGLSDSERNTFNLGRALFNQLWIASPSLDAAVDGLGPTFNQGSCAACHLRNGRGQAPARAGERMRSMLVRLSVPGSTEHGAPLPHPIYGEQLQDTGINGVPAEGRATLEWSEHTERFADGETITLRRPRVSLVNLAFGDAGTDVLLSARVAPQLVGAGLLDAVPAELLETLAASRLPDGISGRVNRVYDAIQGRVVAGRFGWKANASSLVQQTAAAFSGDMGLTSVHFAQENCPLAQTACAAATAAMPDVTDEQLHAIVFYQAALAVPAPRLPDDSAVKHGGELFDAAGCQHCHVPQLRTGGAALVPPLANRKFSAYTDLLLHDMGEGLSDGRPDHEAGPSEWRTAPLWGIGLLPTVNEHDNLLHDGRARGVLEAVMWHGGEAEAARERVRNMSADEREALVRFVLSL